jgi:hypothetical protein
MNVPNRAQRRRVKRGPRHIRVYHALIDLWLEGTERVRSVLAAGFTVADAREAIIELQRAGLARLELTQDGPAGGEMLEIVFDMEAFFSMAKAGSH